MKTKYVILKETPDLTTTVVATESIDSLKFTNNQLNHELRIKNMLLVKRLDKIRELNDKDKRSIEMYNDLIAKHEALKAKWWYKLFTKLESWL